jgi:hypothetical protein
LPVEPACPQECRIQDFRPIGRRHENDADAGIEAVHLDQQLVQGLLTFLMRYRSHPASFPKRIQFVDEDNTGRFDLCLLEQIPHAGCPHPDKHLHELRPADAEKSHPCLSRHGAGQKRLAGSRRADEQDAFRNFSPKTREFFRCLEKLDHLA